MKNFGYLALFVFAIHPVFGGEKVPIVSSFEGRIDFGKHMMLVAIRSESMYVTSRFESLVSTKNSLIVHVLDPDLGETIFLNQMEGIGTYRAVVVPKHEGTVKFLRKKGKPGPR